MESGERHANVAAQVRKGWPMKVLPICAAVLAAGALIAGCQKREPTRPAQPTVENAKNGAPAFVAEPYCNAAIARFAESVRKRHFDLP